MENEGEGQRGPQRSESRRLQLFIALAIVNTVAILFVGAVVYNQQKDKEIHPMAHIIEESQGENLQEQVEKVGTLIPLDAFLVNLAGSHGRKLVKLNMSLEVEGENTKEEIHRLKPKIRDIIIILLSSKSYAEISSRQGKEGLRDEIRDQVNLFLTKGQIRSVYFTQLILAEKRWDRK